MRRIFVLLLEIVLLLEVAAADWPLAPPRADPMVRPLAGASTLQWVAMRSQAQTRARGAGPYLAGPTVGSFE